MLEKMIFSKLSFRSFSVPCLSYLFTTFHIFNLQITKIHDLWCNWFLFSFRNYRDVCVRQLPISQRDCPIEYLNSALLGRWLVTWITYSGALDAEHFIGLTKPSFSKQLLMKVVLRNSDMSISASLESYWKITFCISKFTINITS